MDARAGRSVQTTKFCSVRVFPLTGHNIPVYASEVNAPRRDTGVAPRDRQDARKVVADGEMWIVFEHVPSQLRAGRATLVFESTRIFRRVTSFPADWRTLTDADLYAISLRR
jgi:hypothetical protein